MEDNSVPDYGSILESTLRDWSQWGTPKAEVNTNVVIDREADTYMLTRTGWQEDRRVLSTVFHATVREGQIRIEWDGTDPSLTLELLERGVPRAAIVLAWQLPAAAPEGDTSDGSGGMWRMDVRRRYQTIIKEVLREYEGYEASGHPYPLHSHFVYDDDHADYLMVTVGLQPRGHWPVHAIVFHAWVAYDIVWVACDNVSPSVSEELTNRGIPRRDVRPAREFPFARPRNAAGDTPPAIPFSPRTATYRSIIQEALSRYTHTEDATTGVSPITVFDTHADRYAVLQVGREDVPPVPVYLVLVTIREDRVRIEVNATGDDVARTLTALGILAEAITLG